MKISDMLLAKKRFIVLKESNKRYHIIFQKNERERERLHFGVCQK